MIRTRFNESLLLWALGVLQPASPLETMSFLKYVYPSVKQWPSQSEMAEVFSNWEDQGYIVCLNKKNYLYSLTLDGNRRMSAQLRRQRDKGRLTLLREVYRATVKQSEAGNRNLGGASPPLESRYGTQEGSRPVRAGSEPSRAESTRLRASAYWPRVAEQLSYQVGLDVPASDIPSAPYRYGSFPTLKSIKKASGDDSDELDLSVSQLALCIGVSGRLLTSFTHKPSRHYRIFTLPKKSGGTREIASPRFFLKTVQYWLKDHLLSHLDVHDACHAFARGRSIMSNAAEHEGKNFVANLDIVDFFGSITAATVANTLRRNGLGPKLSSTVGRLVTREGALPQGAPTSPMLSNAVLFECDERIQEICGGRGLKYTRYADDITISGDRREAIQSVLEHVGRVLSENGFAVNNEKTRIASYRSSQRVTGLVVNEKTNPPREFRRRMRALFHNADCHPERYIDRLDEIRGYWGYCKNFESLQRSGAVKGYRRVIDKVAREKYKRGRQDAKD